MIKQNGSAWGLIDLIRKGYEQTHQRMREEIEREEIELILTDYLSEGEELESENNE